ncbi:MAG: hypothetical protein JOZ54_17540, partial [Acidobacteria bacterium]|nr:hypothetical protein [Acidobacteriota bacterium]
TLAAALERESTARLAPAFVFVHADAKKFRGLRKSPSLVAVTTAGDVAAQVDGELDANRAFGFLEQMIELRSVIHSAGEFRAAGKNGDAQMALAFIAYARNDQPRTHDVQDAFRRAECAFEKDRDTEGEERAEMWVNLFPWDRRFNILRTIENTESPRNKAEGWLVMGVLYERERAWGDAEKAFRKAIELAPAESQTAVVARYAIESQAQRSRRIR